MSVPEEGVLKLERDSASSIELSRDAKGVYRWTIKVYFEATDSQAALGTIEQIDLALRTTYLTEEG